jgi:predicted transglutaminase-like cysteine proteinase
MFKSKRARVFATSLCLVSACVIAPVSKAVAGHLISSSLFYGTSTDDWRRSEPAAPDTNEFRGARFFTINAVLENRPVPTAPQVQVSSAARSSISDKISPVPDVTADDEPFGLTAFRAPEGVLWTKWRTLMPALEAESGLIANCRADVESCSLETARFVNMIDAATLLRGRATIQAINDGINNAVAYKSDLAQHGVPDQWSTPLATLQSGFGDCEDYAIAKYVAFLQAGFSNKDLRILLVRDNISREDHAFLSIRNDGNWLVLDNRWSKISPTKDYSRFLPLFAIDQDGVKLFAAPFEHLSSLRTQKNL